MGSGNDSWGGSDRARWPVGVRRVNVEGDMTDDDTRVHKSDGKCRGREQDSAARRWKKNNTRNMARNGTDEREGARGHDVRKTVRSKSNNISVCI